MNIEISDPQFEALLEYVRSSRGFDFTGYKRPTLFRRIGRRLDALGIDSFEAYGDYLEVQPDEFSVLFNTILINVTSFLRDKPAWTYLAEEIVPLVIKNAQGGAIRIWSAACSSGEEAYSLAILFAEAMGPDEFRRHLKIYATDVDEEALAQARTGIYSPKDLETLDPELAEKYFDSLPDGRRVFRQGLRRSIIFGRLDLVQDTPISKLDLVACRNVLMYFSAETQTKVLERLHFALKQEGFLFLGRAEMLLTSANLFSPVSLPHRVFGKVAEISMRDRLLALAQTGNGGDGNQLTRQVRARELAFDVNPVAEIAIDTAGNLAIANERARSLFGIDPRDLGRPFQDLDISYRPVDLRGPIERAYAERKPVKISGVERRTPDSVIFFDILVKRLVDPDGSELGATITFTDVTRTLQLEKDYERSKQELETAYEELQSTNEELETTNEELQSTVEELETTNEELQSTNEELETMNEELQSSNEELQTMNEQLHERSEELDIVNGSLEAILGSLSGGVIVLDGELIVQIWNQSAEDMWGLKLDEVLGQSFLSLDIGLPVNRLSEAIRATMSDGLDPEEHVLDAVNRRGKAVTCRVLVNPLKNAEDKVKGVVVMIDEVTN